MKTYDEETKEEIFDPDLSLGYLYKGTIVVGHVEEHTEVMEGTITEEYPEGWNKVIPAHDVIEECMWYRKYTDEELNAMNPSDPPAGEDVATWADLADAYSSGVEHKQLDLSNVASNKALVVEVLYTQGKTESETLRQNSPDMTPTEIINMERAIPAWSSSGDYTKWKAGNPVTDEGQVWAIITPHRAGDYQGRPSTLRALWSLLHTTNPYKAKPWVAPLGQSGLYKQDECYRAEDGVYQCLVEQTNFSAAEMPSYWEKVL